MQSRSLWLLMVVMVGPWWVTEPGWAQEPVRSVPAVRREFRAVWVATVNNIDWPSRPGLSTAQQQAELIAIIDRAAQLRLNAVIFQVRTQCDAFYVSPYEPWSEFLTGQMGAAPSPVYDPLALAIQEAHRHGLELHAWFNPFRAHHTEGHSPICSSHISRQQPAIVRSYGKQLWLDPAEKATQDHALAVILDVVQRYDIDGVHLDDYFYPYAEHDAHGGRVEFPDEITWQRYLKSGGKMARDDWRRANVDAFVKRLYGSVKAAKRWVKFGISPFGIWRPGNPPSIKGLDAYAELYADSRKWLASGWLDYCAPQLYWRIDQPAQSYPVLFKWWCEQNSAGRHLWPGNFSNRVAEGKWSADEIAQQVLMTRSQRGSGNIFFSANSLMPPRAASAENGRAHAPAPGNDLAGLLSRTVYGDQALVPASPWLENTPPAPPQLAQHRGADGRIVLDWKPAESAKPQLWVLQSCLGGRWFTNILPGAQRSGVMANADLVALSMVDRYGNQSSPAVVLCGRN